LSNQPHQTVTAPQSAVKPMRPDYLPKEDYISPEILAMEKSRLFPKVWQIACRLEEISKVGDFAVYDIFDDSILVVRTGDDEIKAWFNVCQHRGRQLKEGCGNTGGMIQCPFHGWRWNLDGSLARVKSEGDWEGCDFDKSTLGLKPVQVDTWGGAVWINMDPDAASLHDYLAPVPQFLDGFLLEHLRFNWYSTVRLPCNWKVAMDAFNEGYHTEATHPQMSKYGLSEFPTRAFGKHGMFYPGQGPASADPDGTVNAVDARKANYDYVKEMNDTLGAIFTEKGVAAAARVLETLPESATFIEVGGAFLQAHRAVTEEAGAKWPVDLTPQQMADAGLDWHIFPNTIILPSIDGALWYRARPDGDNPNSCFYDIWSLGRHSAENAPKIERKYFDRPEDFKGQCFFLEQDLTNMRMVQKGNRSRGFTAARTNPVQEITVSNFHRALREYIG
jgi:phenylpropionate dioxygenase-like ring-hydroxylating dioxygenase large terminal subunit